VCVVNFPLATTESYRDKNGKVNDKTEWHNIVMWRGLAETAYKYLRKGSTVYLEGKLTTRSWDGLVEAVRALFPKESRMHKKQLGPSLIDVNGVTNLAKLIHQRFFHAV